MVAGPDLASIDYKRQGKALAAYTLLPGVLPRIKETFFSGFSWLAYLMALICVNFRLLPPTTPHLLPQYFSSLTLRTVLADAAHHIEWQWKNIDRILVFFALCIAVGLLLFYLVTLVVFVIMAPAYAATVGGTDLNSIFVMTDERARDDIAFGLLDRIFGIPDMFNSQYEGEIALQGATRTLFTLYSRVFITIALFLLFYHLVTILFETLRTGRPLGERFQSPFMITRLIVAIGLLVPVAHGLNSGQYIVLYIAKFGTTFASNAWLHFSQNNPPGAPPIELITSDEEGADGLYRYLVAEPRTPAIDSLVYYMTLVRTCKRAYEAAGAANVEAYIVKGSDNLPLSSTNLQTALAFTNGDNIAVRFGVADATSYGDEKGTVMPFCGEIVLPVRGVALPATAPIEERNRHVAAPYIQEGYLNVIKDLFSNSALNEPINCIVSNKFPGISAGGSCPSGDIDMTFIEDMRTAYTETIQAAVQAGITALTDEDGPLQTDDTLYRRGWAGAGIWYTTIAGINGDVFSGAYAIPTPTRFPQAMEDARAARAEDDPNTGGMSQFCPSTQEGNADLGQTLTNRVATGLCETYRDLVTSVNEFGTHSNNRSANIVYTIINFLFELDALYEVRESRNTHPMAALAGLGRAMIEKSVRNFFIATGAAAIGGIFTNMNLMAYVDGEGKRHSGSGDAAKAVAGAIMTMAMVGLIVGFIFFYIIPLMPFIYFFFAVARWIKSVFEAMVGIPLWALAHLRLNGEGLPGQAASGGYFLLMELFTRPVIVVFAFFAAMSTFSALVVVLNDIFEAVTANLTGFHIGEEVDLDDQNLVGYFRGGLDRFFYIVVYVAVVYMLALSCFKLIDLIPNTVLRWLGTQVKAFADGQQDAVQSITQYAAFGGAGISEQVGKAATEAAFSGTAALTSGMQQPQQRPGTGG